MRLSSLVVYNFRNLQNQAISFSPGINLFSGRNGQGKTNLLEAIYLLAFGKSFRTATPRECIRHGEKESAVRGRAEWGTITRELAVRITPAEKSLMLHGKEAPLDAFVGNLHVLAFTAHHLAVVRGAPADRRAFLDRAMVTIYPTHVRHLAAYSRSLRQRNRLLAEARNRGAAAEESQLEAWDEALAREGSVIVRHRLRYAARMKEALPEGLFGSERLRMHYLCTMGVENPDVPGLEERYRRKLADARREDRERGSTTVGPHRDDLRLFLEGKALGGFGSAGQQRSALLSLYFAQMEIHRETHGFYPVFLVDDVEAELDDRRLSVFLSHLAERTQTFLTTAKESLIPPNRWELRRFGVLSGLVREAQTGHEKGAI